MTSTPKQITRAHIEEICASDAEQDAIWKAHPRGEHKDDIRVFPDPGPPLEDGTVLIMAKCDLCHHMGIGRSEAEAREKLGAVISCLNDPGLPEIETPDQMEAFFRGHGYEILQ